MIHAIINGLFTPEQAAAHVALHPRAPARRRRRAAVRPSAAVPRRPAAALPARREQHLLRPRDRHHVHARAPALRRGAWRSAATPRPSSSRCDRRTRSACAPWCRARAPRQANCYYSSSDAAFADRYEAAARYDEVKAGTVPLEGGWRVYSSGAGIALRLIHECFLGIRGGQSVLVHRPGDSEVAGRLARRDRAGGYEMTLHPLPRRRGGLRPAGAHVEWPARCRSRAAPNPYRTAGVTVPMTALREHLGDGVNELVVELE